MSYPTVSPMSRLTPQAWKSSISTAMNMSSTSPVKINLKELMRGGKKLILEHGDKPYLLSITRKGKLILTAADEKKAATTNTPASSGEQ